MAYYFMTTLDETFAEAEAHVRQALQSEGFGVITSIDIQQTLKDKIGADIRPYTILGACNPALAYEALQLEDKVGTMLPCNVVLQQTGAGVEVAAIDPVASMKAIDNEKLAVKAGIVASKLARVIDSLGGRRMTEGEARRREVEQEAELSRRQLDAIHPQGTDPLYEGP